MPLKKKQNILYFIFFLSLLVSLYFKENSSGGSKLDSILTNHFIEYFQIGLLEGINYFIESAQVHSPIFYIIVAKIKSLFGNQISAVIYIIISSTLPFLFYDLLKKKFVNADKNYLFFLSLLIFLSPYFRSSASWLTNDNFAMIFFCLSLKYFLDIKNKKDSIAKNYYLSFIFLSLSAYIKQYFGIFIIIYIYELIKEKNLSLFVNCIFLNLILALPFFIYSYNLYLEHNLIFKSHNSYNVSMIDNFVFIFSIFFFYFLPFIISIKFEIKNTKLYIYKKLKLILLILIFTIPIFFFNDLNDLEFGGGVIYKITEKFIYFKNLIFAVVFALTFIFLILLFNKNPKNYLIVFLLCLISFDFVFQKYYDPLLLIVFFTLIDSEKITTLVNGQAFRLKIIYLFYFIFLVSANFYYYN